MLFKMVESSIDAYRVQFIKYELIKGFTEYLIKVIAPGNISFHLRDRYSSMRNFQSLMKKNMPIRNFRGLPSFPPKKLFNNTDQTFLNQRLKSLENFFNNFLSHPEIANSNLVLIYLKEKAADKQSEDKFTELVDYLEKKATKKSEIAENIKFT